LIDANALMKYINEEHSYAGLPMASHILTMELLTYAPTVDAVEVCRCKDCIHWYDKEETCLKIYSDGAVSPYAWQFRKPDDFCSYGERRTE
jgi:hypothetical protein